MAQIVLEDVTKTYPDGVTAVSSLDLDVGDGEFIVPVGPSGCGKTTALRMVAGLESITAPLPFGQCPTPGRMQRRPPASGSS